MRDRPPSMERRTLQRLETIGRTLACEGRLDRRTTAALARPERTGAGLLGPLRLALTRRMGAWWWDRRLAAHGALALRDARPYAPRADAEP